MAAQDTREARILQRLIDRGQVSADDLARARRHPAVQREGIGRALELLGLLSEREYLGVLAEEAGTEVVELEDVGQYDWALAEAASFELCARYLALPLALEGQTVVVAMRDPGDLRAIDDLRFRLGTRVRPVVARQGALRDALQRVFPEEASRHLAREDAVVHEAQTRGLLPVVDSRPEVEARLRRHYLAYLDSSVQPEQGAAETRHRTAAKARREGATGESREPEPQLPHEYLAAVRLTHELLVTAVAEGQSHVRLDLFGHRARVQWRSGGAWQPPAALPEALSLWVIWHAKTLCGLPVGPLEQAVQAPYGLVAPPDEAVRWFRLFFVPVRDGHLLLAQTVLPEVDLGPQALLEPANPRLGRWWRHYNQGLVAASAGRLEVAEAALLAAAEAADEAGEPGRLPLADTLERLAEAVDAAGRPDDAQVLYERALGVKQQAVGPDSPLLVSCLVGLGELDARQGRFEEATERLRAALSRVELAYGAEDLQAAWLLERVGRVCAARGQTGEAASCQQEADALVRRLLEVEPDALRGAPRAAHPLRPRHRV